MKKNRVEEFIKNPKRALFTLAAPIVIAMLVQTLYNVVDTAFIGRLGAEAIAALTFSFPIFFILMAISIGVAAGMSSRISRALGAKKRKDAENTAMHGLLLSIGLAVIISGISMIYLKPIFSVFGASNTVLELSISYMSVVLAGTVFMFPMHTIANIFSAQGDTKTPMKIHITALIINIILDPLLIYVLGYGVRGAAIATTISFFFGLLLAVYYSQKGSYLKIRRSSFSFSPGILAEMFRIGLPASIMMMLMSIYIIFINRFMVHFGTDYVAAYGLIFRLESFAVMPILALAISLMIICGMFYGAKRYDLLKSTVFYGLKAAVLFTSAVGLLFFAFPSLFLKIFTSDAALLAIGVPYLRLEVLVFPFMAIGMPLNRIIQGMGFGVPGLVLTLVRLIIVAIPLSYFFVFIMGYSYLMIAVALIIGAMISSALAIFWFLLKVRQAEAKHI